MRMPRNNSPLPLGRHRQTTGMYKPKMMRRRVSFNSAIDEQPAEEIHALDEEQLKSLWYTKSERREIRQQVQRIIRQGIDEKANDECTRGLELSRDRRRSKQVAAKIDLILERQIENWHAGIDGDCGLGALSQSLSRVDVRYSVKQAELDYVDAY